MTNPLEADYRALHAAALSMSIKMISALSKDHADVMESMARSGAKLFIEIDLPHARNIGLKLVEIEGTVWPVCKLGQAHD
jgi:hypothetical protein